MDYSKAIRYTDGNSVIKAIQVTAENEKSDVLTAFVGEKKILNAGIFRHGVFLIDKGEYVQAIEEKDFFTKFNPACDVGCIHFDGGEIKHFETCPYYPQSLTKLNADLIAALEAEIKKLKELAELRKETALSALSYIEKYAYLMNFSDILDMANTVRKALES